MTENALGLSLALDERSLHPAAQARVHLVAEVTALALGIERARPPLSVVLSVDTSGSMAGPPLEHVVQSIDRLVALLEPTDRIAVVAFANNATEITPLVAATAETRRLVSTRCHRLVAEGGTNIEAGLARAAAALPADRLPHERRVILLLSDGAPNVGRASVDELAEQARSYRPDVSVSTLGYGPQHNEDVLRAIGDAGAGRYHFIADPRLCELEFAQAIGTQGDIVAEAVELTVVPEPGVEIARFVGKPPVRFGASGIKLAVPDLLEGSRYLVAAEIVLTPPREAGRCKVLRAVLSYRRAGERETLTVEQVLDAVVSTDDAAVDPKARAQVLRARADEVRAEARAFADRGQYDGGAAILRRHVRAIEAEPWFVRNDGSPLAEALEQLVDEAVALEMRPSQEAYKSFRKSQIGTILSSEAPSRVMARNTQFALRAVAGKLPEARVVVVKGPEPGRRFELVGPRIVIGRTGAADLRIDDSTVSRQHLVIVGQNGRFLAVDMGSSNASMVNGVLLTQPVPLSTGDVIRVGSVELRYEEKR